MTVLHLLQADGIVEVLGIGRVDGDGEGLAEVAALFDFVLADFDGNLAGFLLHLLGKLDGVFVGGEDAFHLHVVLARLAEHAGDFAKGVA